PYGHPSRIIKGGRTMADQSTVRPIACESYHRRLLFGARTAHKPNRAALTPEVPTNNIRARIFTVASGRVSASPRMEFLVPVARRASFPLAPRALLFADALRRSVRGACLHPGAWHRQRIDECRHTALYPPD